MLDNQTPLQRRTLLHYGYLDKRLGRYVLCCDDARFLNHAADPTLVQDLASDERHGVDRAARDIAVGEELTVDYGLFVSLAMSNPIPCVYVVLRRTVSPMNETVTLYRPTGPDELELVRQSGFKRWPPRLPEQPIFYPVTNEQYAMEIATRWNIKDSGVGYVTRFEVKKSFMDNYEVRKVGGAHHTEWWIPAEELEQLNDNIVGLIEVIGEYRKQQGGES